MLGTTATGDGRARTVARASTVAALALLLAASGCGSDGSSGPADLSAKEPPGDPFDAAAAADRDLGAGRFDLGDLGDLAHIVDLVEPYPPGPYGAEEGDVPPNFTWKGYLDLTGEWPADKLPLTDVSLQQLRLADGRYLFIATGAYW